MKGKIILLIIIISQLNINCKNNKTDLSLIQSAYLNTADTIVFSGGKTIQSLIYNYRNSIYAANFFYDKEMNIKEIEARYYGSNYGHHFKFDYNGKLNPYLFDIGNDAHYSFGIELVGNKYNETGSIFVDYLKHDGALKDSITKEITLFFSSFPRSDLSVLISFDGDLYKPVALTESKLMPLLKEVELSYDVKKTAAIYLKVEGTYPMLNLPGIAQSKTTFDTLLVNDN